MTLYKATELVANGGRGGGGERGATKYGPPQGNGGWARIEGARCQSSLWGAYQSRQRITSTMRTDAKRSCFLWNGGLAGPARSWNSICDTSLERCNGDCHILTICCANFDEVGLR